MRVIVLDTNCLLAILPSISPYHRLWREILNGSVDLCISTEILEEYEEILAQRTTPNIARLVLEAIISAPKVKLVNPTYFYHLITSDPDDNKFVDCAICGNADLIVTNDSHFDVLRTIDFPKVEIIRLPWNFDYTGMNFDGLFLANG
ncbi:MAG: putative toxin-antitoxin system toxin component, PIN family, partial [Limosilactobacillus mucosae]|nr:putative toxin-antitoxin system toxin component, PIN family [Limosilactobacillus mucosae]